MRTSIDNMLSDYDYGDSPFYQPIKYVSESNLAEEVSKQIAENGGTSNSGSTNEDKYLESASLEDNTLNLSVKGGEKIEVDLESLSQDSIPIDEVEELLNK